METNLLIYRTGCEHCLEYLRILDKVNVQLPLDKKIRPIDSFEFENFNIPIDPVAEKLVQEGFDAYPFLFLGGVPFQGGSNAEQLLKMLLRFFKDDLLYNYNNQ